MMWLIGFELRKRWESLKWPALYTVLAIIGLGAVAAIVAPPDYPDVGRQSLTMSIMVILSTIGNLLLYFPLIDAAVRFVGDLRGRHAPLELGAALPTWQKVAAKVTASLALHLAAWIVPGLLLTVIHNLASREHSPVMSVLPQPSGVAQTAAVLLLILLAVSTHAALRNRTRLAGPAAAALGLVPVIVFGLAWPMFAPLEGPMWFLTGTTLWIVIAATAVTGFLGSVLLLDHRADI